MTPEEFEDFANPDHDVKDAGELSNVDPLEKQTPPESKCLPVVSPSY